MMFLSFTNTELYGIKTTIMFIPVNDMLTMSTPYWQKRLDAILELHLSDSELTVNKLCKIMKISRTDLHRKLMNHYEISTTEYIRRFRVKRAATMLQEESHKSILQIALETGFSSQAYFTYRFKKIMEITPGQYRLQNED